MDNDMHLSPVKHFGVLDKRFLARSIGLLNPKPALTLHHKAPVSEALLMLRENKIGCIVVTDDDGKVAGIFTERDVVLKLIPYKLERDAEEISTVMTEEPHTEQTTTTIAFALNMMSQGGFRHIPVVDDKNFPVGVISTKDIVDYIVNTLVYDLETFE